MEQPLCAASVGRRGLSSTWRAAGPDDRALLSVQQRWTGIRADVHLERGGAFVLRGSAWKRDFTVTYADGTTVVTAVPGASARLLRPYDYAVQQAVPVFTLAELVALVQSWRMARKRDSAHAAGAAG